eukprot:422954_1
MPALLPEHQIMLAFFITLLIFIVFLLESETESENSFGQQIQSIYHQFRSQAIGDRPAVDVFSDIYGTVFFKHETGMREDLFDYIFDRMDDRLSTPRDIYFENSEAENNARKKQPCKLSNANRLICFFRQMRKGKLVWCAAYDHGWNICSVSMDFFHCLLHFVDEFYDDFVTEMTDNQKRDMLGMFDGYPLCYQTLDGSQFLTTKSTRLPEGVRRREMYCWKHRWPEGKNVQAVISHYGHATQVKIGPGAANDAAMSADMCLDDDDDSTLVDDGYPNRRQFILPDESDEHKAGRTVVERYFSRLKMLWGMVGGVYTRGKRWHDLVLRAAFILTNMVVMWEGPLNTFN